MLVSAGRCLMALAFASAALATPAPWFEGTILGRDLNIRQNSDCDPNGYRSANGLNFTTYCGQNNPFNDAEPPFKTSSMTECMERCSRYAGNGEGCFGIVWTSEKGNCWIRNSTTGTKNLRKEDGTYSALLVDGQMSTFDTKCPAADASTNELPGVSGLGYTMNCNKAISGYDTCFSGMSKPCFDAPYSGYFHTETMEECIQICVDQHPLCKAVTWSPELKIGFANCIPKTGYPEGGLTSPGSKQGILHTATITRIDTVNRDCPKDKTYTTPSKSTFDVHCGQASSGTNMTMLHAQNVTSCMDACAASEQKCVGVVFDGSLAGGFKNCYLQNTTNTVADLSSYIYASLSSSSSNSGNSNNGNNNGNNNNGSSSTKKSKSTSKAWIAGVVIGAIAALALIAFAIWWFRRRRAAAASNAAIEKDGHEFGHYGPAPAYSPGATQGSYTDAPLVGREAPMELSGQSHEANELPATGSTKYASERKGQVSELP